MFGRHAVRPIAGKKPLGNFETPQGGLITTSRGYVRIPLLPANGQKGTVMRRTLRTLTVTGLLALVPIAYTVPAQAAGHSFVNTDASAPCQQQAADQQSQPNSDDVTQTQEGLVNVGLNNILSQDQVSALANLKDCLNNLLEGGTQ
ncbi:hypothetical protein [Streptomyces sp. NPDC001415]